MNGEEIHLRDMSGNRTLVVFGAGDEVVVQAGDQGVRFLLVSGAPIKEPVAWHGPIVMNTREELITAVNELRSGTFIKKAYGWADRVQLTRQFSSISNYIVRCRTKGAMS